MTSWWTLHVQDWAPNRHREGRSLSARIDRSIMDAKFVLDEGIIVLELGMTERNGKKWLSREVGLATVDLRALKAMIEVVLERTLNNGEPE